MLGLELRHIGINSDNEEQATQTAKTLCALFDLECRATDKSYFVKVSLIIMSSSLSFANLCQSNISGIRASISNIIMSPFDLSVYLTE